MLNDAAWLDTDLFAPRDREEMEAEAITRPGMSFLDVDGARLRVRVQLGPGPTVIILPDGPNTIEQHDLAFERLASRFAVVAIDVPGFGFSWANRADALTFDGAVAALLHAIDQLVPNAFIVTGSCIQAYVAIAIAAARPERACGVIAGQATDVPGFRRWIERAVDPAGFLRTPMVGQMAWARAENRHRMAVDGWYRAVAGPDLDLEPWQQIARWSIDCGCSNSLATVCQTWLPDDGWSPPTAECAGVILFGEADRTHRRSDPDGMTRYLPHAKVHRLPRAGHFPELEAIDAFEAAVLELSCPRE